jgi:hypothetical protein
LVDGRVLVSSVFDWLLPLLRLEVDRDDDDDETDEGGTYRNRLLAANGCQLEIRTHLPVAINSATALPVNGPINIPLACNIPTNR